VLRLGSVILAAALLGVPRALDTRAFGSPRWVYIDVAPAAPELTDFLAALEKAIDHSAYALAAAPSAATTVIEVGSVTVARASDGRPMEAATLVVREGASARPLVLHYAPPGRARAVSHLLETLSA
jgi:hypothetical protein